MTYGQLKFRLTKAFPGVDLDLIEGWINDVYRDILGELPWQRQQVESMLLTVAPYTTGYVGVASGSTSVSLVGGTWSPSMNGRAFRTPPRSEFYQFTYISSTSGSLDRPYEGTTLSPLPTLSGDISDSAVTAMLASTTGISNDSYWLIDSEAIQITTYAGNVVNIVRAQLGTTAASHSADAALTPLIPYTIFQHIYPLPSNCRLLEDDAFSSKHGLSERFTHAQLNISDPNRVMMGTPQGWASYMDDNSTPPNMQVELYPVPDKEIGIPFTYVADGQALSSAGTLFQFWMQPSALVEGVTARIKAFLKDYDGAQLHGAAFGGSLQRMRKAEAQGMAPAKLTVGSYFTRGRMRRGR